MSISIDISLPIHQTGHRQLRTCMQPLYMYHVTHTRLQNFHTSKIVLYTIDLDYHQLTSGSLCGNQTGHFLNRQNIHPSQWVFIELANTTTLS